MTSSRTILLVYIIHVIIPVGLTNDITGFFVPMKIPSQDVITYVEIINLLQREIKGMREPHRATRTHSLKEKMSSVSLCDAQSYLLFLLNNIYYRIHFQAPWTNVASAQPSLTAWTLLLHIFPCPMESHSLTLSTGMFLNLHQNISMGKLNTRCDLFLQEITGKLNMTYFCHILKENCGNSILVEDQRKN